MCNLIQSSKLIVILTAIILITLGGCLAKKQFKLVSEPEGVCIDSVSISLVLNDSIFNVDSINTYVELQRQAYPYGTRTPQIDSLIEEMDNIKIPKAIATVTNLCSEELYIPSGHYGSGYGFPFDISQSLLFQFGKIGNDSVFNLPHGHEIRIIWVDSENYYISIIPNENRILNDTLEVFEYAYHTTYNEGHYWLVVYYQNYFRKEKNDNYWLGKVKSDTVWFRLTN